MNNYNECLFKCIRGLGFGPYRRQTQYGDIDICFAEAD